MATVMWQRGRRLFSVAAILMILTALAHAGGEFAPSSGPEEDRLLTAMESFRIPLGFGMNPSVLNIFKTLGFTMTISFLALGSLNLLIAGSSDTTGRLLKRITFLNALWVGAFLVVTIVYQIPPPLISALIIEAVLLASLLLSMRRHPS